MVENDGGPAFPQLERDPWKQLHTETNQGMSLRDYFAGQALAGLLASVQWSNSGDGFGDHIAAHASNIADAMLAARGKRESGNV